ncbi:MAG: glycosyltransferase family 2 protein [Candidatus Tectomicrobia bacterium]|nr:glycosyltransferase family 2 protein [Candidatus Tectomicrobia bacterium]
MQNTSPVISVMVPCRNEKGHIEPCIRSILAQESPPGGFEIIVADGWSDDGTLDILERLAAETPRLQIVNNPSRIVSTGLNAALRVARGKIIIRMDAHTEYAPDYIRQCVAVLTETGADNVGGPARTKATGYVPCAIRAAYHSPFAVGGAQFHNVEYEGPLDTVPYGCWPREVFDRIGTFDDELVRNQDDELNLRLIRAGGCVWQSPRIKSWYWPRRSLSSLFKQYAQYGYWKVRVIQKHRLPASIRHLVPGGFILALTLFALVSLCYPPAIRAALGMAGLYAICTLSASLRTASQYGWRLLPLLPLVFACFHFAYGYGFLWGMSDFIVRHRGPQRTYTELTRSSAKPTPRKIGASN